VRVKETVRTFSIALTMSLLVFPGCGGTDDHPTDAREGESSAVPRDATYWRLEDVSDGGRELVIRYFFSDPACESLRKIDVDEGAEVITITVLLRRHSPPGKTTCLDVLNSDTATLHLERPLGDRLLRDPAAGLPKPDSLATE
jgi:hypothetical protein